MNRKIIYTTAFVAAAAVIVLNSCKSIPNGAVAVKPFKLKKYLGKWFEIARMDYYFERNLNNVTANYSLNENGTIKVDNKGFDFVKNKWKESIGKAKPASQDGSGELKVSFFGPFYAGYNVVAIDKDYKYALVMGKSTKYLWILSRETSIPENVKQTYLQLARNIGYDTEKLTWVKH